MDSRNGNGRCSTANTLGPSEVASVLFHGTIIVQVHVTVTHDAAQPILRAHSGGLWSFVLHEILQVKETTVEKKDN